MKQVFLITAFEPFGGAQINNSWEIAQKIGEKCAVEANPTVQVVCEILPVSWSKAKAALKKAVAFHNPQYLLSLGLASGTACLRFERVARNEAINYQDNEGKTFAKNQTTTVALAAKKPLAIPSTLPEEWLMSGFGDFVSKSDDAGGYLCNYVFFQNMVNFPRIKTKGFIHVCDAENEKGTEKAVEILSEMIKHISTLEPLAV